MKKNMLKTLVLAFFVWTLLPACSSDTEKNPALQAPTTAATEQATGEVKTTQAESADTTAQTGKPAGISEKKKSGKDSDDDDDDK
jgi:outer membrane biogenesis lipoprotein LolB